MSVPATSPAPSPADDPMTTHPSRADLPTAQEAASAPSPSLFPECAPHFLLTQRHLLKTPSLLALRSHPDPPTSFSSFSVPLTLLMFICFQFGPPLACRCHEGGRRGGIIGVFPGPPGPVAHSRCSAHSQALDLHSQLCFCSHPTCKPPGDGNMSP